MFRIKYERSVLGCDRVVLVTVRLKVQILVSRNNGGRMGRGILMDHFDGTKGSKKKIYSTTLTTFWERKFLSLFDCERVCVLIIAAL